MSKIIDKSRLEELMGIPSSEIDVKDNIELTHQLHAAILRNSQQKVYDTLVARHGTVLKQHQYEEDYITHQRDANLIWCTSKIDGSFGSFEVVRHHSGVNFYFSWSRDDIRDEQTSK